MAPSTNIPMDVLHNIQLHTITPGCIPVDDDSIPLILCLQSQSEDTDTCNWLRVLGFEVDIVQGGHMAYK